MMKGNEKGLPVGLGRGRPLSTEGPLANVGRGPDGRVLAQRGNSCGTTCASAVMAYYGREVCPEKIDREIRNANIFTAPGSLPRYFKRFGLDSGGRNRGSIEEVLELVDRGIPAILLVDTAPRDTWRPFRLHYVVAVGHRGEGGDFRLGIFNPWGLQEEITGDELSRIWDDVRIGPFSLWESYYIPVAPKGTRLPILTTKGARGINMMADAVAYAVNGVCHLARRGSRSKGLMEVSLAIPLQLAGSFVFLWERIVSLVGNASANPPAGDENSHGGSPEGASI